MCERWPVRLILTMFIATNWPECCWTTSKELIGTAECVKLGGALSIADYSTCVDFTLYGLPLLACTAEPRL